MLHVGLTGGIASGKSTVAGLLGDLGAHLIDADRIARDVVAVGTPGLAAVREAFGPDVIGGEGALDRRALAQRVFEDAEALAVLNGIVHPLVRQESAAQVAKLPGDAVVVHDVPLIVENRMGAQFHLVVVIGASVAVRTERAVARGLTEAEATARIAAQADDAARRLAADVWVDNEGSPSELSAAVERLWTERIVPFAQNLAAGRWSEPGHTGRSPDARERDQQINRLIARIERAADGRIGQVSSTSGEEARLEVIDLSAVATTSRVPPDALLAAGLVAVRTQRFASADPAWPATLRLTAAAGE